MNVGNVKEEGGESSSVLNAKPLIYTIISAVTPAGSGLLICILSVQKQERSVTNANSLNLDPTSDLHMS